jgi:hypothetical protein
MLLLVLGLIMAGDQFLLTYVVLALKKLSLYSNRYSVLCSVICRSSDCFGDRVGKPTKFCDLLL